MSHFDDREVYINTIIKACRILYPVFKFQDSHGITNVIHMIAFSVNVDLTCDELHHVFTGVVDSQ